MISFEENNIQTIFSEMLDPAVTLHLKQRLYSRLEALNAISSGILERPLIKCIYLLIIHVTTLLGADVVFLLDD